MTIGISFARGSGVIALAGIHGVYSCRPYTTTASVWFDTGVILRIHSRQPNKSRVFLKLYCKSIYDKIELFYITRFS